jgi:hypothetical protein
MVLHCKPQIGNYRDEPSTGGKIEGSECFVSREPAAQPVEVQTIVNRDHSFGWNAFRDQVSAGGFAIGGNRVRKAIREALGHSLKPAAASSLPSRGYSDRHTCELRGCHAEHIRIEVVCLNYIDATIAKVRGEPAKLSQGIPIIETRQRILGRDDSQPAEVGPERPTRIEAGYVNVVAPALRKKSGKLQGLKFRAALLKATDEL